MGEADFTPEPVPDTLEIRQNRERLPTSTQVRFEHLFKGDKWSELPSVLAMNVLKMPVYVADEYIMTGEYLRTHGSEAGFAYRMDFPHPDQLIFRAVFTNTEITQIQPAQAGPWVRHLLGKGELFSEGVIEKELEGTPQYFQRLLNETRLKPGEPNPIPRSMVNVVGIRSTEGKPVGLLFYTPGKYPRREPDHSSATATPQLSGI